MLVTKTERSNMNQVNFIKALKASLNSDVQVNEGKDASVFFICDKACTTGKTVIVLQDRMILKTNMMEDLDQKASKEHDFDLELATSHLVA
jgi:predicted GTPase